MVDSVVCAPAQDYFKSVVDSSVDIVFTSPPYNRKRNDKYSHYRDDTDWSELLDMTVRESMRVLKPEGYLFLNIQRNYYNKREYFEFMGRWAHLIVDELVWVKSNPMPAQGKNVTNSYEVFLVLNASARPLKAQHTYTKNAFQFPVNSSNIYKSVHKAVMSPDVARHVFENFIPRGLVVLDPFMGVGTTGVVASEYGHTVMGCDITPEYTKIANERIDAVGKENNAEA